MLSPTTQEARRRSLIVAACVGVVLVTAFLAYAVWGGSQAPRGTTARSPADAGPPITVQSSRPDSGLAALSPTSDPKTFAGQVAETLFAWDTATLTTRADHVERLVAVADPSGESAPGLVADLDNYLPTPEAWAQLGRYETRQWLTIGSIRTPSKWAEAEAQAGDKLLPGTTAFTVHGTRHRSGVWEGETVSSAHEVAFTVFIVCGPAYPQCHLLRLSMLDKPLA